MGIPSLVLKGGGGDTMFSIEGGDTNLSIEGVRGIPCLVMKGGRICLWLKKEFIFFFALYIIPILVLATNTFMT